MNDRTERVEPEVDRSRNLEELIELMNESEKLSFKQAIVRQIVYYVSKKLPPEDLDSGERGFIWLAERWLEEPTEENAEKAATAASFDCVDGGVRYFDYSDYFLEPAWVLSDRVADAARRASIAAGDDSQAAERWQVLVALAILNRAKLPLFA